MPPSLYGSQDRRAGAALGKLGGVILSEVRRSRTKSKDPYYRRITIWPRGAATNLRLLAAKGVPRLRAALVAWDDTQKTTWLMNNPGKAPLYPLFAGYRNFEIVLEPPSPGASRFQALRVRRRQTVLQPVLAHFNCLMSADRQVRARSSSTQQRKSRLAVLRKKSQGIGLVTSPGPSIRPAQVRHQP